MEEDPYLNPKDLRVTVTALSALSWLPAAFQGADKGLAL